MHALSIFSETIGFNHSINCINIFLNSKNNFTQFSFSQGELGFLEFHRKFVLASADKAANNFVVV